MKTILFHVRIFFCPMFQIKRTIERRIDGKREHPQMGDHSRTEQHDPAGRHDGERLVQLHAELPDRAFDAAEEVVVQARLHGRFRGLRQNRLRTGDLHFRQLRGSLPQRGRRGSYAYIKYAKKHLR